MKVTEAIKKIYPSINGGYSYFQTRLNGSAWDNPIDGLVWENQYFAKPTWSAIQAKFAEVEAEEALASAKELRLTARVNYIASVTNEILSAVVNETTVDSAVASNFAIAKQELETIESATTLQEVENINIDFIPLAP